MCRQVCSMGPVFQRHLLQLFLLVNNTKTPVSVSLSTVQVPSDLCPPGSLRLSRHPQHPPLLSYQESRETQTEASGQQGEG